MIGNDQKSVWEHHLGVRTIILGCLGVHMSYFHVTDSVVGPARRTKKKKKRGEFLGRRVEFHVCAFPFRGPQRRTPCLQAELPFH